MGSKKSSKKVDRLSKLPEEIVSRILSLMHTKFAVRTSGLSKSWRYRWMNLTNLKLPSSMFTCKTLTKLKLDGNDYYQQSASKCPSSVYFPFLKTLDITVYTNCFGNASKLINGCPVLERLSLQIIWRNEDVDYIFNIPTLKRLKLTLPGYASFTQKVVLNVPNLEYLFLSGLGGALCSNFIMEDVSSLVEASVSFDDIASSHRVVELLKGLSGVKSLSVQSVKTIPLLPIFPDMQHLELKFFLNSKAVFQFLESCPELKHLHLKVIRVYAWVQPKFVPACVLKNLTTIKFSITYQWKHGLVFLKYILGNAEVLKTVTITCKYPCTIKEESRLRAKLFKFPRASRCCEIHFRGKLSHSTIS